MKILEKFKRIKKKKKNNINSVVIAFVQKDFYEEDHMILMTNGCKNDSNDC